MRVILVDDERLAVERLKKLLENKLEDIEVIGAYGNPLEAEVIIKELQPDIVFLDIEMPGLNGLLLGERIAETNPAIKIVFVTASDCYTMQAFKLYAFDYIMKPIQLERLSETMERLRLLFPQRINTLPKAIKNSPRLNCFKSLTLQRSNGKIETIKWRTSKAQELFSYMLHHRNQIIYRDTILDLLWPDFDIARGSKQLYTTIYHIRQTLKSYGLEEITISRLPLDNGYRLHLGALQIDIEQWKEQLMHCEPLTQDTLDTYKQLLHAYKGDYFEEYDYLWAESEREQLRQLWLNHAQCLHNFYVAQHMVHAAITLNKRIQQHFPVEEHSYFNLMKLYNSLHNGIAVEDQYKKLVTIMSEQLDAILSEQITMWYERWKQLNLLAN